MNDREMLIFTLIIAKARRRVADDNQVTPSAYYHREGWP